PEMQRAPDLTLVLADHGFVSVRNREPAVVTRSVPLGTHHPDGVFVMAGAGVGRGRGEPMSSVDTTAIVAHSLGLPVPADFEGQVPPAIYDPAHLAANPVRSGPPTQPVDPQMGVVAPAGAAPEPAPEQREEILA